MIQKQQVQKTSRITLADVAREASVSVATASLALRNIETVSVSTRRKVQEAARRLDYVYHFGAASLRTQRTYTVGLILPQTISPFFSALAYGIESTLNHAGYATLLALSSDDPQRERGVLRTIKERQADGLILCASPGTEVENLKQLEVPTVLAVRDLDIKLDYVGADNYRGAVLAVNHLLTCGYRTIAFIGGYEKSGPRVERIQGYVDALTAARIAIDRKLVRSGGDDAAFGYRAVMELIQLGKQSFPDAIFCYNDVVALGVMAALHDIGRPPGSVVGVVGFDDIAEAVYMRPALTTIAVRPGHIGKLAAQTLLRRLNAADSPLQREVLTPELIVRDSCPGPKSEGTS